MNYKVVDHENGNSRIKRNREDALKVQIDMKGLSDDVEIVETDEEPDLEAEQPDGGQVQQVKENGKENGHDESESVEADVVDHSEDTTADVKEAEVVNNPEALAEDPIGWLESINMDFVNTIKGKPAISKQGFRFIQSQFGITTKSDVVEVVNDPLGVVVWAKAELPDGQSAEAHGEGWKFEDDVDDNEFVRYADTRAKNRAISDLTSAGALAVSELGGNDE